MCMYVHDLAVIVMLFFFLSFLLFFSENSNLSRFHVEYVKCISCKQGSITLSIAAALLDSLFVGKVAIIDAH